MKKNKTTVSRADDFKNILTGIGVSGVDSRTATSYYSKSLSEAQATALWRSDGIASAIIECVPHDALRSGFDFVSDGYDSSNLRSRWEDLRLVEVVRRALCMERAYGCSAIIIGDDSATDSELTGQPISLTCTGSSIRPIKVFDDITKSHYGQPAFWEHTDSRGRKSVFHHSRVVALTDSDDPVNWCGPSVLGRCYDAIRDYEMALNAASHIAQNFSFLLIQYPDVAKNIAEGKPLLKAVQDIKTAASVLGVVLVDSLGTVKRETTSVSGLTDIIDKLAHHVAASARVPMTRIFGVSPGGLGSNGEGETRAYFDHVRSYQDFRIRPAIEKILAALMGDDEPENWRVDFAPLWQPSEKDMAEAALLRAQTAQILIESGLKTSGDF
jgi:phage-related protein (TIGR01555 family)